MVALRSYRANLSVHQGRPAERRGFSPLKKYTGTREVTIH